MKNGKLPLGRDTGYPDKYAPELLYPIARADSRTTLGIGSQTPFHGVDTWNAWELTWLRPGGRPEVATAEIVIPADSPNLVESKSLKLYLNSFAMTEVESPGELEQIIRSDVGDCVGVEIEVRVQPVAWSEARRVARLAGDCIDSIDVTCTDADVTPAHLRASDAEAVREDLYTHLLRSLCPVTGQPDFGTLLFNQVVIPRCVTILLSPRSLLETSMRLNGSSSVLLVTI